MKFVINNQEWSISELEGSHSLLFANNTRCQGTTHYAMQEIYLDNSLTPDRKKEVLFHELAHCFLYATQAHIDDTYSEEFMCDFIALYGMRINEIVQNYFLSELSFKQGGNIN